MTDIDKFKALFELKIKNLPKTKITLTRNGLLYYGETFQFIEPIKGEITDEYIDSYIRILDEITRYVGEYEDTKYILCFNSFIEIGSDIKEFNAYSHLTVKRINDDEVRIIMRTGYSKFNVVKI